MAEALLLNPFTPPCCPRDSIEKPCRLDETRLKGVAVMKRLCTLCAIALMGSAMAIAQDQPTAPRDNTPRTEQYGTHNGGSGWGWLGLLGLLGLAGLRRGGERVTRTYYDDKRDDNIRGRAA